MRSVGAEPRRRPRPNLLQWLGYAFWRPLPDRYSGWVLYDATCSTWVLRHAARLLTVLAVPVAAIAIFVPAPVDVRVPTALAAGALSFIYAGVWINESTEHRLVRAGWPASVASRIRERRSEFARS